MNTEALSTSATWESGLDVSAGVEAEDPYRWLEEQDSLATRDFVRAEQEIYRDYLDRHKALRERIERRVTELLMVTVVDLPVSDRRGGLLYLKRSADAEQKAIYHCDDVQTERLLISVDTLGRDCFTSLAIIQISRDGRFLVFGIRTGGEDVQEIGFYGLIEGRLLPDRLPCGFYRGLVFSGEGFYYVHEEACAPYDLRRAVRRHQFGNDPGQDRETYYAGDGPALRLILQGAEDGSSLGYHVVSLESNPRTRFLVHEFPLDRPPRDIIDIRGASFGARFTARYVDASTTFRAPGGRIVRMLLHAPKLQPRTEIAEHAEEALCSWEVWGDRRVIHYCIGTQNRTRIYSATRKQLREISYPESGTTTIGQVDVYTHKLFYSHTDITKPPTLYAVDLMTGEHRLWWRPPVSPRPDTLEAAYRSYRSKDETEIPITLIHPKRHEGTRPILLGAYGGNGVNSTPKFSVLLTILTEAGITCATAHVRGGGEGGLQWHLAAQKQLKQTSVDDIICAAEWLIEQGWTTENRLGVAGQSGGALLALCAITQRPQLFRAAMALGPLADLTRFHLFGVARGFVAELGSPDDPSEFSALHRLSPYHRVQVRATYPAVLVISGDCDKRCDALHARKMIARLKDTATKKYPVLLDYTETRGHKPVLPLSERIRGLTNRLTFLIVELGMEPNEEHPS